MAYQFKPIKTKYKNRKVEEDGIKFASKKEAMRWKTLVGMQHLGIISDLRRQQTFYLSEQGRRNPETGKAIIPIKYVADFAYIDTETGKTIVEDVKGYRDPSDAAYRIFRIKQKLMFDKFGIWVKEI